MSERHTVLELLHADELLAEELDAGDGRGHQEPVVAEPAPTLAAGEGHEQGHVVWEQGEAVHLYIGAGDHLITYAPSPSRLCWPRAKLSGSTKI